MISHTTERFRKLFAQLPRGIQKQAKEAYIRFEKDPYYPGLRFKQVHSKRPIYAVRISRDYRALGVRQGHDVIVWFWVGSHADYDKILRELKKT